MAVAEQGAILQGIPDGNTPTNDTLENGVFFLCDPK